MATVAATRVPRPAWRSRRARRHTRAAPAAAAAGEGESAAAAVLVLHESTAKPAVFADFLEGALHVQEVSRSHPWYAGSALHTALDAEAPWPALSLVALAPPDGAAGAAGALDAFEDLPASCEFGFKEGSAHVLAAGASAPAELDLEPDNVVLLAALPGADADAAAVEAALGAVDSIGNLVTYRQAAGAAPFGTVVRAELGELEEDDALAARDAVTAAAGDGAHVGLYRVLYSFTPGGPPVGLAVALLEKKRAGDAEQAGGGAGVSSEFVAEADQYAEQAASSSPPPPPTEGPAPDPNAFFQDQK